MLLLDRKDESILLFLNAFNEWKNQFLTAVQFPDGFAEEHGLDEIFLTKINRERVFHAEAAKIVPTVNGLRIETENLGVADACRKILESLPVGFYGEVILLGKVFFDVQATDKVEFS
jgi:hypothetical protein